MCVCVCVTARFVTPHPSFPFAVFFMYRVANSKRHRKERHYTPKTDEGINSQKQNEGQNVRTPNKNCIHCRYSLQFCHHSEGLHPQKSTKHKIPQNIVPTRVGCELPFFIFDKKDGETGVFDFPKGVGFPSFSSLSLSLSLSLEFSIPLCSCLFFLWAEVFFFCYYRYTGIYIQYTGVYTYIYKYIFYVARMPNAKMITAW